VLLVPIGSCEQHGPHLPLDTDTRIATALATAAGGLAASVFVAPAIAMSASGEHSGFAGTLSIGTEALVTVLVEVVRSADWVRRVVFVNGHGGNVVAVRRAVEQLRHEGHDVVSFVPNWPDADAHAGRFETSLMLAIAPETVRLDRAEAGETAPLAVIIGALRTGGVRSVSANGVLGDPAGASADEGRQIFGRLVDQLVMVVGA
jgi:mycofactocin precursor peptide peptidase